MPVRVTEPDPRIDAVRGCVAIERGPIVYCVETADLPAGTDLEAVELSPSVEPAVVARHDVPGAPLGITLPAIDAATGDADRDRSGAVLRVGPPHARRDAGLDPHTNARKERRGLTPGLTPGPRGVRRPAWRRAGRPSGPMSRAAPSTGGR